MTFDEVALTAERHEMQIKSLQHQINDIKEVTKEIKTMNETLIVLTEELKHTNEHLKRHERKIEEIDSAPKNRMQQIVTAIIAALAGCIVSSFVSMIIA